MLILFLIVLNYLGQNGNCQELVFEPLEAEYEITSNLSIELLHGPIYPKSNHEWTINETFSKVSANEVNSVSLASNLHSNFTITFYNRYYDTKIFRLVTYENYCTDPSLGPYFDGGKFLDCILAWSIYDFYKMLLVYHSEIVKVDNSETSEFHLIISIMKGSTHESSSNPCTTLNEWPLKIDATFANHHHDGKIHLENLKRIHILLDDYGSEADFKDISVKKSTIAQLRVQVPLNADCPHFLHDNQKLPSLNKIDHYHVRISQTHTIWTNDRMGMSSETRDYIIDTSNEISKISRFSGGFWKDSINDYHFGIKYVIKDGDNQLRCRVEPLAVDNDQLTTTVDGSLSFNQLSGMNQVFIYAGKYEYFIGSTLETCDVWQRTQYYQIVENVVNKMITTLLMVNQSTYNERHGIVPEPLAEKLELVPVHLKEEMFEGSSSSLLKWSSHRYFYEFKTQPNTFEYSESVFGHGYMDKCHEQFPVRNSLELRLVVSSSDINSKGIVKVLDFTSFNASEVKMSIQRIVINHLHISYLRIKSIEIELNDTTNDMIVVINVSEAVDLMGLHTKTIQRYDLLSLQTFHSIDVESDRDCFSKQKDELALQSVISCSPTKDCQTLDKFLCIGIKSGQSLPIEHQEGIACSVFNNAHNTLATVAEETSLKDIIKYSSSRLRGLTFQVNQTIYRITSTWNPGYLTDLYARSSSARKINRHRYKINQNSDESAQSIPYLKQSYVNDQGQMKMKIAANSSESLQSTNQSHSSTINILIVLLLTSLIVGFIGKQIHRNLNRYNRIPTSSSSVITLETIN